MRSSTASTAQSTNGAPERRFRNRQEAGRLLAERLGEYKGCEDALVLALPRGGVPVGLEIARALGVPLDVFLVRKLGLPGQEELAMGAIASGGARVLNEELVATLGLSSDLIDSVAAREQAELERRERAYRGERPAPDVRGRTVIVVDDGLATGSSMRAAIAALRQRGPKRIVVAVPAAPRQTCDELQSQVDELVVLKTPHPFYAVGAWYEDFSEVSDEQVRSMLAGEAAPSPEPQGDLVVPEEARGVVLFAHGSGSSRLSPRNRFVAGVLNEASLATYLVDLLTEEEEEADRRTGHLRFDVQLLGGRVLQAMSRLEREPQTGDLPLGLFGASTGAGAALVAAAERPDAVGAVVSRGGRPDLAADALESVRCPTLLIVGERDEVVIDLNREAMARMSAPVRLEIVPGATHLFPEPGALERVADLARDWFASYLVR
jgi:putative phosphoribosyl transferase